MNHLSNSVGLIIQKAFMLSLSKHLYHFVKRLG
jgi:hypothetical protein